MPNVVQAHEHGLWRDEGGPRCPYLPRLYGLNPNVEALDTLGKAKLAFAKGSGWFPTDMLRYDSGCALSPLPPPDQWAKEPFLVLVALGHKPTVGRWSSFRWEVELLKLDPATVKTLKSRVRWTGHCRRCGTSHDLCFIRLRPRPHLPFLFVGRGPAPGLRPSVQHHESCSVRTGLRVLRYRVARRRSPAPVESSLASFGPPRPSRSLMPDANKFQVLRDGQFSIPRLCLFCRYSDFSGPNRSGSRVQWGTCTQLQYEHGKHTGAPRGVSIVSIGSCPRFEEDQTRSAVLGLGAHAEFLPGRAQQELPSSKGKKQKGR